MTLQTPRLLLRPWRETDLPAWTAMNQDLRVREFLTGTALTADEAREQMRVRQAVIEAKGFGIWAAELRVDLPGTALKTGEFVGCIGVGPVRFAPPFQFEGDQALELAWRLCHAAWGHGLATEGARAAADWGLANLPTPELVAYTLPRNTASRRVMERIGMQHNLADDFDHPNEPPDSRFCRHVLYRLRQGHFLAA